MVDRRGSRARPRASGASAAPGARRKNALATRAKLMSTGRRVFARKGLGGVSLREDILAAAGVSTGSFYHQFEGKEHLLVEIIRHDAAVIVDAMTKGHGSAEPDPVQRGIGILESIFDLAEQHPEFMKIYLREYHSDSREVRRCLKELREQTVEVNRAAYRDLGKELGLPLDHDAIARMASLFSFAIVNEYLDAPRRERPRIREKLIRGMVELMAGGITNVGRSDPTPPR